MPYVPNPVPSNLDNKNELSRYLTQELYKLSHLVQELEARLEALENPVP